MTPLLDASCRLAFAALLHDIGKFAERAAPEVDRGRLDQHITDYCKWHEQGGYHSHKHAAYTSLFMDVIEQSAPDLIKSDAAPFASRQDGADVDITDCLINAAAMHHRPETLLQWIIATADRVASGFEREDFDAYNDETGETFSKRNHFQARLLTLFEQVRLERQEACDFHWRYPLLTLSPNNLFPQSLEQCDPGDDPKAQAEYRKLWADFLEALQQIPASHRSQWPLWLDHLDTLWQSYTHAIPSSTFGKNKPEISLYDHSKATAAFAVALWRWHVAQENLNNTEAIRQHKERTDWNEQKFLLVQGDFFGIQDFIFADGAQTNKSAARILRGRSFQVSLFTELAALKVLEACELPSTSQIINAAGKFLIVAPNTEDVRAKLETVRRELNQWFLDHTFGLAGLGLAYKPVCCNDFLQGRFEGLMKALFEELETAKLKRFDLTGEAPCVFKADYPHGDCPYNTRLPADDQGSAPLSRDQIEIGKALAHRDRLLIVRDEAELRRGSVTVLEVPIFGYRIGFTGDEEVSGKFGELARSGGLVRCWDFSLPENLDDPLWHGYARRYINAYVPFFDRQDQQTSGKYREAEEESAVHAPKTFNHLACEDRQLEADGKTWIGQIALATLKGDVDELGQIFQKGLKNNTFAKMAALSRQINAFFAVWLPAFCKENYPDTYTVFAGGDDFFLIGPWRSTQSLAADMAEKFKAFVAENTEIHFSAGIVMSKPGHPVQALAQQAETALEKAKGYESQGAKTKNALCLYGEVVPWSQWQTLADLEEEIRDLAREYDLSTGYIYGLLALIDLACDQGKPESAMWRSRFAYRTRRYVVDKLPKEARDRAQTRLADAFGERGIARQKGRFRIPLFNFFYSNRRG